MKRIIIDLRLSVLSQIDLLSCGKYILQRRIHLIHDDEPTNKPWVSPIVFDRQSEKMLLESHDWIRLWLHGQRSLHLINTNQKANSVWKLRSFYHIVIIDSVSVLY